MIYLFVSGIIALAFGLLMLIAPQLFKKICDVVDKVNIGFGRQLQIHRIVFGGLLIIIAIWGFAITLKFPQFKMLHIIWLLAFIFGFFHIFFPGLLSSFSGVADKTIFPTKEYLIKSYRSLGAIFVLAGIFILLIVYWFK